MMKLEPGAPLPHDLPPDAQRYRVVQEQGFRDRGPMALGIVVAAVAFAVAAVKPPELIRHALARATAK